MFTFLGLWLIVGALAVIPVLWFDPLRYTGPTQDEITKRERRLLKLCLWGVMAVLVSGLLSWAITLWIPR